jgi:hypothetical protein
MADWTGLCSSEFYGGAAKTIEAMEKYPGSQEPEETGFSLFHCPGQPMFAHISKDPKRAKRFGNAMASLTGGEGYEVDYMLNNYSWGELDKKGATVVDVSLRFVLPRVTLITNRSSYLPQIALQTALSCTIEMVSHRWECSVTKSSTRSVAQSASSASLSPTRTLRPHYLPSARLLHRAAGQGRRGLFLPLDLP